MFCTDDDQAPGCEGTLMLGNVNMELLIWTRDLADMFSCTVQKVCSCALLVGARSAGLSISKTELIFSWDFHPESPVFRVYADRCTKQTNK